MKLLRLFFTRSRRRLLVAGYVLALLFASAAVFSTQGRDVVPLQMAVWAEFAACVVIGLLGMASGFGWNHLGQWDERQRVRWTESKALAYQILLAALYPCLFWFGLTQVGFAMWVELNPARRGLLASVLLIASLSLPIAITAWREPDLAEA